MPNCRIFVKNKQLFHVKQTTCVLIVHQAPSTKHQALSVTVSHMFDTMDILAWAPPSSTCIAYSSHSEAIETINVSRETFHPVISFCATLQARNANSLPISIALLWTSPSGCQRPIRPARRGNIQVKHNEKQRCFTWNNCFSVFSRPFSYVLAHFLCFRTERRITSTYNEQ